MKKRVLSMIMALALCLSLLPAAAVPARAATYSTAQTPTVMWPSYQSGNSMVADVGTVIILYANGTPLVIKEGTEEGRCTVYDSSGNIVSATQLNGPYKDQTCELKNIYFGANSVIYGGCNDADYTGDTSVTLESGQVVNIFGGGHDTTTEGTAIVTGNTSVEIKGGTITGDIYGGGHNNTDDKLSAPMVSGNASVTLSGDSAVWRIYGGGLWSGVSGNTTVTVAKDARITLSGDNIGSQGANTAVWIHGGGYGENSLVGEKATVTVEEGATVTEGDLYGGGRNGGTVGNTVVTVAGTVNEVYGGGYSDTAGGVMVSQSTDVTIQSGGTVLRTVYGGGYQSGVGGNTSVTIQEGAKVGGNEHNMTDDVYGGGSGGTVSGTTTVTVSGTVDGSVYGGGTTTGNVTGTRNITINAPAVVKGTVFTRDAGGANYETTNLTINGHDSAYTLTVSDGNIDAFGENVGQVRIYLSAENAADDVAEKLTAADLDWSGIVWDMSNKAVVSGAAQIPEETDGKFFLKNLKLLNNAKLTIPAGMVLDIGGDTESSITGTGTIQGPGTLISGFKMTQNSTAVDTDDGLTRKYYMNFLRSTSEGVTAKVGETDVTGVLYAVERNKDVVLTLTADGDHNLPADATGITVKRNNPEDGTLESLDSANYTYTRTDDKNGTLTIPAASVTNALQIAVPGVATKTSLTIGGVYSDSLTSTWGDTGMTFRLFPGYEAPADTTGTAKVYAGGKTYGTWSFNDPENAFTVSTLTGYTIYDSKHPGGAAAGGTEPFWFSASSNDPLKFTVTPKTGLTAGTYTATATFTHAPDANSSDLSFDETTYTFTARVLAGSYDVGYRDTTNYPITQTLKNGYTNGGSMNVGITNANASVSVGSEITLEWQWTTDLNGTWTKAADGTLKSNSGSDSKIYPVYSSYTVPTNLTAGTYYFRCLVTENADTSKVYGEDVYYTVVVEPPHTHNWTYSTGGANTITATCVGEGICPVTNKTVTITLSDPDANSTLTYTGSAVDVTATQTPAGTFSNLPDVVYTAAEGSTLTEGKPINAGTYTASITMGEDDNAATAYVEYTIGRATGSATVSMSGYTYNGTLFTPDVSANPGNGTVTFYYNTTNSNSGGTEWKDMTATSLDAGTYYMYAVIAETANYEAYTTEAVSFTVSKADQTAPAAPAKSAATDTTITLNTVTPGDSSIGEVEYKYEGGVWQDSPVFTGLTAAAQYTFYVRYAGDSNYNEAVSTGASFYTAAAKPADGEGYTIDYVNEAITVEDGYILAYGGYTVNSGSIKNYIKAEDTVMAIRVPENGDIPYSAWTFVTIPARPAAPVVQSINETAEGRNDGKITGTTTAMEYSDNGTDWTACTGTAITGLADGTYYVRVKAVAGTSFAGTAAEVVIITKSAQTVTFDTTDRTATYGDGALEARTATATGAITYSSSDDTIATVDANGVVTVRKAGEVTITATAAETDGYAAGSASYKLTIAPKALTITVADKSAYVGSQRPDLSTAEAGKDYTVDGLVSGDTLTVALSYVTEPEMNKAGEYEITATAADSNYVISVVKGKLVVSNVPIYSDPTYTPTVEGTTGGETTVSDKNPHKGDKVTITTVPNEGYEVGGITVTDSKGNEVEVIDNGDGTYTFVQPVGKVTITVTYVCSGTHNCPSLAYSDLNTSLWYHKATDYVIENGLMNGIGGGKFGPSGTTSRAMIVTILWRLEGKPVVNSASVFNDVENGKWYSDAIAWANMKGIVEGYNGSFNPHDPITREQFATILWRYAQYKGYDVSVGEDTNILSYADAFSISEYAIPAMQWACGVGVIDGKPGNILDPKGSATRIEAAQMLMNYLER